MKSLVVKKLLPQFAKDFDFFFINNNCIRSYFSFITADKAVGSQGFRIIWTEIQEGPSCDEFQCSKTGYCIPNKLRCDLVRNCGADDDSDEADCE